MDFSQTLRKSCFLSVGSHRKTDLSRSRSARRSKHPLMLVLRFKRLLKSCTRRHERAQQICASS